VKNLLALLKPWQWITLGVAGCFLGFALLCAGGFPINEDVPGLTHSIIYAKDPVKAREAMAKCATALRTTSIILHDDKDAKRVKYTTAVEASGCRANQCKKQLAGTGLCHGGDLEKSAACLTAFLRAEIGTEDFPLDEPSKKDPTKSGRELFCAVLDKAANACDKLSK
jgi:hypothetical protein